jgi:hypothetical protein
LQVIDKWDSSQHLGLDELFVRELALVPPPLDAGLGRRQLVGRGLVPVLRHPLPLRRLLHLLRQGGDVCLEALAGHLGLEQQKVGCGVRGA